MVEMTYGHLGRSRLVVSRIGLGTMAFGFTADESTSYALVDTAIDAGINVFDTADVYGGPQTPDIAKGYGISEEVIGRWLACSGYRDQIVLATRCTSRWVTVRMTAACPSITSGERARRACAD